MNDANGPSIWCQMLNKVPEVIVGDGRRLPDRKSELGLDQHYLNNECPFDHNSFLPIQSE